MNSSAPRKLLCFLLFVGSLFLSIQLLFPALTFAQAPTPTLTPTPIAGGSPGTPQVGTGGPQDGEWRFDAAVTEAGKNSERARELLYWVFSHPAINRAPVLANMWSISRNIVYVFFLLVIAAGGIGYIVSKREGRIGPIFSGIASPFYGFELPSFILKVAGLLLYATFSYVFVLGLIEFAQILQNFFIKTLGGCNLFNINFGRATECIFYNDPGYEGIVREMERNYTEFVGYRDITAVNQEMANTSLFFVKLTTLTYNIMSIMLILRDVILWFLLIVSPFLALLMPFIFIRNIGWIWIGTFLQWLFYGPLLALFVTGIVRIWQAGIPYAFNFERVGDCANTPFPTSINILWGGPAQTLGQCNSANYIDTYAEYVVALIMLWAAILLPWLLLRIFRDYCCDILRQNQSTLQAIYNQLRQTPPPAGPTPRKTEPAGRPRDREGVELPFRRVSEEERKRVEERRVSEVSRRRVSIENIENIRKMQTEELTRALDLSVNKLRDVARYETNVTQRREVEQKLQNISNPARVSDVREREKYTRLRNELSQRAEQGDRVAERILQSAARPRAAEFVKERPVSVSTERARQISQETGIAEKDVVRVTRMAGQVSEVSREEQVGRVAKETGVREEQVEQVLERVPTSRPQVVIRRVPQAAPPVVTASQIKQTAQKTGVTQQNVSDVVRVMSSMSDQPAEEQIEEIRNKTGLSEERIEQVVTTLSKTSPIRRKEERPEEAPPEVTVEDYEEVKQMWVKHYRETTVPETETVRSRKEWIRGDIKKITNAINLMQAKEEELKEEGLQEVERLLPFLLLGGFTDEEAVVYLKAKLEAARQIEGEVEQKEKVREEVEAEQEEELIEVPSEGEEEEKTIEAERAKKMDLPEGEKRQGEEIGKQENNVNEENGGAVDVE